MHTSRRALLKVASYVLAAMFTQGAIDVVQARDSGEPIDWIVFGFRMAAAAATALYGILDRTANQLGSGATEDSPVRGPNR